MSNAATDAPTPGRSVLLADGRPAALGALAGGLARDGLRVLIGSDAGMALDVLARERPAMALLHHELVGADGAILRHLRSLSPALPIVIYGGQAEPGTDVRRGRPAEPPAGTATMDGDDPARLRELVSSTLLATSCIGRLRDEYELRALFLTRLCHALRAPLHVIQGYAELLRDAPAEPAVHAALAGLAGAVASALQITAEHVAVAGLDTPGLEVRCEPIELDGLLDELRRGVVRPTGGERVRLLVSAPFPGALLYADGERLRVLLAQLIARAAQYPTRRTLRLRVGCTPGGTRFELTAGRPRADGGPSMPADDAGWAIAERLSLALGASLAVRQEPAGGTAIVLELPVSLIATPAASGRPLIHRASPEGGTMARKTTTRVPGHRILVVDDQPEVLHSVRGVLERQGHQVLTAASGDAALELFKSHEVHLLLIDYYMPAMNGETLVREIRRFDPYVQIILQTGYAGEKPASRMMAELDIQGYHDKADGPDKLLLWVEVGLKAHRLTCAVRERERVQQELVANVSHELRTPLHIIGGYTDLLLNGEYGDLPPEACQSLRRMATAADSLGALITDLLSYARVDTGLADAPPCWTSLEGLIGEAERLALLLLDNRPVRFAVDLGDAPTMLRTDPIKVRTILRNLVTNAVKFTPSGSIALHVVQADGGLCFTVQDTGIGIAREEQELIFEPFRQVDSSATRRYRGIGLGLALARKLARTLGGDIAVTSEVGCGSAFTLTLPCDAARAADAPGLIDAASAA